MKKNCEVVGVALMVKHCEDCPCHEASEERESDGPSTVVSDQYRTGWEGIFGKKNEVAQA